MSETPVEIPRILKQSKVVMLKGPNKGKIRDHFVAQEEANTILEGTGHVDPDNYHLDKEALKALQIRSKDYILTSQAAKTEESRKNSEIDDLTKVFNQKGILRRVEGAIEQHNRFGTRFAVLFMDIDGFKKFNDTFGHQEGNKVLTEFAQYMEKRTRKYESFGRFGGDEFVDLLENPSPDSAKEITERVQQFFLEKTAEDVRYKDLCVSLGVKVLERDESLDAEMFLYRADAAMYQAKRIPRTVLVEWREGMVVPGKDHLFSKE